MAKQNYRCAGCGIRTDPGKSHLNDPRALSSPRPQPVLGDEGERGQMGEGKNPRAGREGITSGSGTISRARAIPWRNWLIAARL